MRQEDLPKANATCPVCGNKYYRCEPCIRMRNYGIEGWRLTYDNPLCYQTATAFRMFDEGVRTKEETKEFLKNVVYDIPNLTDAYKNIVDAMFNGSDMCEPDNGAYENSYGEMHAGGGDCAEDIKQETVGAEKKRIQKHEKSRRKIPWKGKK